MSPSALPRRFALRLLALAVLLIGLPTLHASPITYQMTFTSGSHTGTGTLTLASQPGTSGVANYTVANQQLQDLTFTVAGQTYNFSADPSASAQFVNGQISKLVFDQTAGQDSAGYTVAFANGFSLYGGDLDHALASGSYTITPDTVTADSLPVHANPTPEPRSLLLLTTAVVGGALFLVIRRARKAHS